MEKRAQATESLIRTSSGQAALDYAVQAAELYMRAAGEASTKKDAARLRLKCQQLIAQAEKLKAELTQTPGVLLRTSKLHSNLFPPWTKEPSDEEFQLLPGDEPFTDNAIFTLSPRQTATFGGWKRPRDLHDHVEADDDIFMNSSSGCDLVQDMTTDCSVVASLCAAMNILTGRKSILSSILYPFDRAKGTPKESASGKYVLKLYFNGCFRRVVVDERLPSSISDRTLYVVDRVNPQLIWPALLEKAYLKVRGGYDFPGSNSGTDLWVLTGWIPEQIFLQREDLEVDKLWKRIKNAHDSENVVVTLGTGRISAEEEDILGLIGEHDYAIMDLEMIGDSRRLLVKNPWCDGPVWKGGFPQAFDGELPTPYAASPQHKSPPSVAGSFWMTLEDVLQHFESMYLNWNPALFPHRQDHHFTWCMPPPELSSSLVRNPQYSLHSPAGGPVWILVSRHFVDEELEIARNRTDSMAAVDTPLPSTEGITESISSPPSNRHRTPSVSLTPPGGTREESHGLASAIHNIRLDANGSSLSPEPRRRNGTPRRRRSSTGAVQQHDVADEELPDDAFHSPEFQGAFRDAKQLMSNIQSVLGSSNVHEGSESTMRKLHEEAGKLAAFEYPATRTVGFVGDSGVGKSSLLNSLLDTKGLARTSNNGEACTCVVTEYRYHNLDTLEIRVNLFSTGELRDQLGRLLQVYRTFELHQDEITDAAERQDMEANAKVAKDTFRAMFRGRMTNEAFLIRETYEDVLERLTSWASDARPPLRTWTGLSPQACSDVLMELSSEPASRNSPATWPYIRSIKVFLNAHILSRGLILVDLPGLRDLNSARRNITERYLLECNEIFAICNIGRAATDEGVHQVFDLADRARLSNVGIVCTRSDDIDPEESIRDWPGRRARHIEQLLEHIEATTKEIAELQAEIEDFGASDLSEQERQEFAECLEEQRQASTRKQNYEFELKAYLITSRNQIIIDSLNTTYAGRVTPSRVFCVSNTIYWQNRTARKSEAKRYLDLSGILQVRKHCISIVANSQRRIATQYMKDQIPALLADIELWVQSGARTASEERREALCQTLDSVERRLRKDFTSRAFSRLARGYNEDFAEYVWNNRHVSSWSRSAKSASQDWAGWHHSSYSAFCRNFGNYCTPAIGSRNWNEEAMGEMASDLERPWEEMCGALQERQLNMLENADEFADMAMERLEEHDSIDSLTRALENRQSMFLAAIEKVNDDFENNLRILRIESLSALRSSLFGKSMEPFYNKCNAESGRGSDARRKAIIRGALSDQDLFTKLMGSLKDSFKATSEATQAKIQEATVEYLRVIEQRFDLVRSENVARESEQDPDFRLRVERIAQAGRETMQRVHQVI